MITKNERVRPFRFTARYHFVLGYGFEDCRSQLFKRIDIEADKSVISGTIMYPHHPNHQTKRSQVQQVNCSLTINLMRKVVDAEKIYSAINGIVNSVRSLKSFHRYKNPMFEDFSINVRGRKFQVNKKALAAVGWNFVEIFDNSKNNEHRDDETDPDAFDIMLQFIYGVYVDFNRVCSRSNENEFFKLLQAAIKYGVRPLREICIGYMLLNFTISLKDLRDGCAVGTVWALFEFRDYCREVILL